MMRGCGLAIADGAVGHAEATVGVERGEADVWDERNTIIYADKSVALNQRVKTEEHEVVYRVSILDLWNEDDEGIRACERVPQGQKGSRWYDLIPALF